MEELTLTLFSNSDKIHVNTKIRQETDFSILSHIYQQKPTLRIIISSIPITTE